MNRSEKQVPDDVPREFERLRLENEAVAQQVKRLIKAESKLYEYQEKLDAQVKQYKGLYELSRKFNTTFDIPKIFEYTVDYVIHHLEYERVLIFRQREDSSAYAVCALDGYYNHDERSKVAELAMDRDDPVLDRLRADAEYLICSAGCKEKVFDNYRAKLLMDEYLIYPLGPPSRPLAVLAVGNSSENAGFFRRVTDNEGELLGAGHLAGLLTSSIENRLYYASMEKALEQERIAETALQNLNEELEARVKQRTSELSSANLRLHQRHVEASVLYQVSSAISRSLHMDKLLTEVLGTISRLEVFNVDKGGIFVIEGDRMRMIAHLGHSDAFLNLHKDMHVGDCLCGIVAKTGEILISPNSAEDGRHTIVDRDTPPHGHLIVPLKTRDRVEGVLDLYLPVEAEVDEDKIKLLLSIGNQLGIAIENARLYEKTKALSLRDSLTGLWNHEEILRILGQELTRSGRSGTCVGVIMADLDYFKRVNDTHGHMAGDAVLRSAAARMISLFRSYDAVGRYGGEEFMIVLPGCDGKSAAGVAERMRKSIGDESMDTPEGMIPVTLSLGVAVSRKGEKEDVQSLVRAADYALYQAKKKGRNRVEIAR